MAYDPPPHDGGAFDGSAESHVGRGRGGYIDGEGLWRSALAVLARTRLLWSLAVTAMVLDIALTGVGLSLGLQERNPVALAIIDSFGLLGAGAILKGGALALGYVCWRLLPSAHRGIVPLGLAIPSWAAVCINTVMILSIL